MTETIEPMPAHIGQQQLAHDLVEAARTEGIELIGPGGLLTGLTKTVLETALEAEMSEHLGYDRYDPAQTPDPVFDTCEHGGRAGRAPWGILWCPPAGDKRAR